MKISICILVLSFILCACPFESKVPIATAPIEAIDSSLLGYWYVIVKDGSDFFGIEALDIEKKSDSLYAITRYGKAAKGDIILPDTSHFTGYISYIGDRKFMTVEGSIVLIEMKGKKTLVVVTEKIFYTAQFETRHDTLLMKTITENFPGAPRTGFKNSNDFTIAVTNALNSQKNIYDDLYALSYKKIVKPVPLKSL